jgi:hypothetical protein
MNSSTLQEKGFEKFVPLKELAFSSLPFSKSSVLILADITLTGKPSDIIYIGKSKKPAKRVFGGYLAGYGGKATKKIHNKILNDGYIEKISISWMLTENPKTTQQELLESYKKIHGAYPAWNNQNKAPQKARPAPKVAKPPAARKQPKQPPKPAT